MHRYPRPDAGRSPLPPVAVPRLPEPARPLAFPVAATLAPVAFSVMVWAVTRSAFALVFAALGPVVALASLADGALHGRRRRRREDARFARELSAAREAVDAAHAAERASLVSLHGAVPSLRASRSDPDVWSAREAIGAAVRVGTGAVESAVRLDREADLAQERREGPALRDLTERARRLVDAPVVVDARDGVGFCGATAPAIAAARAFVMRLAREAEPTEWSIVGEDSAEWRWLADLPHRWTVRERSPSSRPATGAPDGRDGGGATIAFVPISARFASGHPDPSDGRLSPLRVATAATPDQLPRWCRHVVVVDLTAASLLLSRGATAGGLELTPDLASAAEASRYALELAALAREEGMPTSAALPDHVDFGDLDHPMTSGVGLPGMVGLGADGAWCVDLVADGPHVAIGGTTGSGKSELLVTLVLAVAARHPPERVTFLLVDFKGGSAFDGLNALPHRVGTITDLDPLGARRALESLRAEVMFRERALADAGVRSIDDSGGATVLTRLVIVVDEFAALAGGLPELHALFADLAARGRSLGIHLVLCTQRPAGSLRDAILANCTLRISLRVNDAADSSALLGSSDAAHLPRRPLGRALVSRAGEAPQPVQVAISSAHDVAAVAARRGASAPPRRPWLDPLPTLIPLEHLPNSEEEREQGQGRALASGGTGSLDTALPGAVVFGLTDLPHEQRQCSAVWRPRRDGHLVIRGGRGAGKSTMLAAIAARAPAAELVPLDVEGAWDAVARATVRLDGGARSERDGGGDEGGRLLLIDDVDWLAHRMGRDHELEFVSLVTRLVRDGPRHGIVLAIALGSAPGPVQTAVASCEARPLLRMPNRQEHLLAGGASADFDESAPPGAARWRGHRVQIGWVASTAAPAPEAPTGDRPPRLDPTEGLDSAIGSAPVPVPELDLGRPGATAVVSTSPRRFALRLAESTPSGQVRIVELAASAQSARSADPSLLVASPAHHVVVVGDPDAWQSAFAMLATVRGSVPMVFDGCSVAEFRAVTRSRRLPPALDPSGDHGWLLGPDDVLSRVELP